MMDSCRCRFFAVLIAAFLTAPFFFPFAARGQSAAAIASVPDFPVSLRRSAPVSDISDAVVYTVNEEAAGTDYGTALERKVGSDVMIRAWFKWDQAPPFQDYSGEPAQAHALGALFGGGITCSALYDGENGITQAQLLDMATRAPDGSLVNAWGVPGVRHGSLSSPAYVDYLFRWCRQQIDAGADYLFMDENTAALTSTEGYDEHSLDDFRSYLIDDAPQTRGWAANDPRWTSVYGIVLADPALCRSGDMSSFDFRAYLRSVGALSDPTISANRLYALWTQFKTIRDDRVWHGLVDRIHAYAHSLGRTVYVSGNGLVKYADLEVMGVWGLWKTSGGHIDLSSDDIPAYRALVVRGQSIAERKEPVVFFHDWGMGNPPFPWLAVPASERAVWMRTVGAEIYAAGGFFAFPVHGPFGCDSGADGTLPLIAHLSAYYHQYKDLYLHSRWLGCRSLQSSDPALSLAASWIPATRTIAVHVINRDVRLGVLARRGPVTVLVPVGSEPARADLISPDFDGRRSAAFRMVGGQLAVTIPSLDAYSVALLRYASRPDLTRLTDPIVVAADADWDRPTADTFTVGPDGSVSDVDSLSGFLQGKLHPELSNPPTFLVDALPDAAIQIHVRAVATLGAILLVKVDGAVVREIDLPDRDGKNDPSADEYDQTFTCPIPAGHHRVGIENVGGDWAVVDWYSFTGMR